MLMVNKPVCDADAIVFQAIFCTNEIVHTFLESLLESTASGL